MKKRIIKKLNQDFLKIVEKFQKINWPKAENALFLFLILFCLFFGLTIFGIGEKIKNEKDTVAYNYQPEIYKDVEAMVQGSPMERMVSYLSGRDKKVAAFLVAIAKKESDWGKHTPKKEGRECFNYWGYRGDEDQTESGYSCFRSPRQAVNVVGNRLAELIEQNIDTPQEMIVWKCGQSCEGHEPEAVAKWISDVDYYFRQLYN